LTWVASLASFSKGEKRRKNAPMTLPKSKFRASISTCTAPSCSQRGKARKTCNYSSRISGKARGEAAELDQTEQARRPIELGIP